MNMLISKCHFQRVAPLLLVIVFELSCSGPQKMHTSDRSAVQQTYYEELPPAEIIRRLHDKTAPGALYLSATLYDETGNPNKALDAYIRTIETATKKESLAAEATASALAIVTLRERATDFETTITQLMKKLSRSSGVLPLEALYQLKTLYFSFALKKGLLETAATRLKQTGCLPQWQLAGPFEPSATEQFMPLLKADTPWPTHTLLGPGRPDVDIKNHTFHVCQVSPPPSWSPNHGTLVALSHISLPHEETVHFRLQGGIDTTVYLNGKPIFTQSNKDKWLPDVTWFSETLPQGHYKITVNATAETHTPSFSLSAIHGSPTATLMFPHTPLESISQQIAAIKIQQWNNDPYETYTLQKRLPDNISHLLLITADEYAASPLHAPEIGYEKARGTMEIIHKQSQSLYRAALFLAKDTFANGHTKESIQLLTDARRYSPNEPSLPLAMAEIFSANGWFHEAAKAVNAAEQLLGRSCNILKWRYHIAAGQQQYSEAAKIAEQVTQCNATSTAWATELTRQGNFEKTASQFKRIAEQYPNEPFAAVNYADALFRAGKWSEGLDVLKKTQAAFPLVEDVSDALIEALFATEKYAKAQKQLRESSQIPPSLRKWRWHERLGNEPLFHEYRINGREAVEKYLSSSESSETDLVWVLDRMVHFIDDYGNRTQLTHWIAQVNTLEMLSEYAEIAVPYGETVLTARTIKNDISVYYPITIENKPTISMPNLKLGDFIEFESVAFFPSSQIFLGGFDTGPFYFEDFDTFFMRSEVILIAPERMNIQFDYRGTPPPVTETRHNGLRVITFRTRNQTALHAEPDMPSPQEFLSSVRMTSGAEQSRLCTYLYKQYRAKSKTDPRLEEFVKAQQEKAKKSNVPIAPLLYRWVLENIEEDAILSDPASHIFSRHRGNRVRILQALLQTAGISSQIGFVTPTFEDNTQSKVPDINKMAFTILQLEDGTYLSLSDDYASFGFIPAILRKQPVLFPSSCKVAVTDQGSISQDAETVTMNIRFDDSGNAVASVIHQIEGEKAVTLRDLFTKSADETQKLFEEVILNVQYPNAILESFAIENNEDPSSPITFKFSLKLPQLTADFQAQLMSLPLHPDFTQLTQGIRERKFPLVLSYHNQLNAHISVKLPDLFRLNTTASNRCAQMKDGNATYCIEIEPKEKQLDIQLKSSVDLKRLTPSQFNHFHEFTLITEQMNAESIRFN